MNSTISPKAKFFSRADANRMLPYVRAIAADIVRLYAEVHDRRKRLSEIRQKRRKVEDDSPYEEELRQAESELEADIERLEEYVDELRVLGLQLKDPVKGLVDFPALVDGEEVHLCWMLGEESVDHWHPVDAGFDDRRVIDENFQTDLPPGDDLDDTIDEDEPLPNDVPDA